jgi:hypothetical protein
MFTADPRATSRRALIVALSSVWLVLASACASDDASPSAPVLDVPETVSLGAFPEPLTGTGDSLPVPSTTVAEESATTTTEARPDPITGPIGDEVVGNRVLVIGDTVIASTAPRFGGSMCDALEAFGWQAEIAAEVGRFVEFGRSVVEARVTPDEPEWDAAVIMLGNHFDGRVDGFRRELEALITSLSPRPILVDTLVEDDTFQAALNEIIRDLPRSHPNVVILDWAVIAAAEPDVLLADTPSGLSDEGRNRLALFTVAALGEPPVTDGAGCVPPVFVDDSAIVL